MNNASLKKASNIINQGGLVAFPTETVYGLGANAFDNDACLKIYKAKGRPSNNPLIVHVLSIEEAQELAHFNDDARKLSTLWPGPLTMVLPKKSQQLALSVTAGLDTVAIRIPAHPVARELLLQSGLPIAAPSANKSGRLSPTSHKHVEGNFGDDVFILKEDVPATKYGLESTIIDLSTATPTLLRFGFITPELIEQILNKKVEIATESSKIKAPGMMHAHYAPQTPLRINAEFLMEGEIGLGFGRSEWGAPPSLNLSPSSDLAEAASNLFDYLHKLDDYAQKNGATGIAVAPIPNQAIGLAINDRLKRAAKG
jgi:L-threonylcarbamoyladenylate synthase